MLEMEQNDSNFDERDTIKAVHKAIEIMEYLSLEQKEIGVREASRILDVPKSTVQRIFNTLLADEIVDFDEKTQSYSLGNGMLRLFTPYVVKNSLISAAKDYMERLSLDIGETVGLHTYVNGKQMVVHQYESMHELKWSLIVGKIYPLNAGASGKTLLAYLSKEQYEKATHNFNKVTEKTLSESEMLEELRGIRDQGFSISQGEFSLGEMGIAVPVFKGDKVIASLSIYGPESRLNEKETNEIINRLTETSKLISQHLY
jgi:DNA-binding IclR family transcriptional regulator